MIKELLTRIRQGERTIDFPPPENSGFPPRFRGAPKLDTVKCADGCRTCAEACPTGAVNVRGGLSLDMGKCLFCPQCSEACDAGAIRFSGDYRLAAGSKADLVVTSASLKLAGPLPEKLRKLFAKSFKLRQVSAGGCNGCEAEITAMGNVVFDCYRFGVQMVASPRHADGLLLTGPVTENMKLACEKTLAAIPEPKVVIAVGACAISGGPYFDRPEQNCGADSFAPSVLYIPGCPPHPLTILDGILRLLGRAESGS